ncbi:MAG: GAF domain-containing protein [Anaerolineales bacterium]
MDMKAKEFITLNEIATVVNRSLDLDQILDSALEKTLQTLNVETGGIYLLNGESQTLSIAVQKGFKSAFISEIDHLEVGEGFSGKVVKNGSPLVVKDVSQDERLTRSVVQEEGLHSLAIVPLSSKGKVLGTLFLITHDFREFSESEMQLLTSIGRQVGMAVENARLFQAEQRRAEQFRVISEMGRQITSIMDIDQVLEQVVKLIQKTFGYDHVAIATIEDEYAVYRVGAGRLWEDPSFQFKPSRLKIGKEGITGWVADTGKAVCLPDVSKEPRYIEMEGSGTRSELIVPVKVKGNVIGVLDVQSQKLNAFDESDMVVMQSLADQTAIALENSRLYERARHLAVVEERNRLARELHDSVTQALYGITLHAEATYRQLKSGAMEVAREQLTELRDTAQEALREMRLLIFELRPSLLEQQGLVSALRARIEAVEERAGMEVEFIVEGDVSLPNQTQDGLYRISQEALNNALKHANAQKIHLRLTGKPSSVVLEIIDDGVGFDPDTAVEGGGLGLDGMIERAEQMGVNLTLGSKPGQGTNIIVEVPRE